MSLSKIFKQSMMEILNDGKEHTREEIITIAEEKNNLRFSAGVISGAIRVLHESGYCTAVQKGVYKKISILPDSSTNTDSIVDTSTQISDIVDKNIARSIASIKNEAQQIDIFSLKESDLLALNKIPNFINQLEELTKQFLTQLSSDK